jgi:glycosyltransferase involved in cell wall biosynthesis
MGGTLPKAELTEREQRGAPAGAAAWPRVTVVTAVRNGAKYIEDTIRSIVSQGYPNLEYIVVDGVSTDGTLEVIRKYEKHLAWWVSQPDRGVYDALNTGFARSTGEIMGWLNASDLLHINSLFVVGSVFAGLSEVEWITGRPTGFNASGMTVRVEDLPRWSRYRFLAGANRYIQQESTFWRRSLWNRAGGSLNSSYRAAGDFDQWVRFFRHAKLYSVDAIIGGYRFHADSLSARDMDDYHRACDEVIEEELKSVRWGKALRIFRRMSRVAKAIPVVRGIWRRLAIDPLYHSAASDWPPRIENNKDQWLTEN